MKVAELIKRLQEMQDYCGDCVVRIDSEDYYTDIHRIDRVAYDRNRDTITILTDKY